MLLSQWSLTLFIIYEASLQGMHGLPILCAIDPGFGVSLYGRVLSCDGHNVQSLD